MKINYKVLEKTTQSLNKKEKKIIINQKLARIIEQMEKDIIDEP